MVTPACDMARLLSDWAYDPERISVRRIVGLDGALKIQMRVDLGVLQLEYLGRPDGRSPGGCPTLLDDIRATLLAHERRNGAQFGFALSAQAFSDLADEIRLYYQRLLCLFVLDEYGPAVADIDHCLDAIEFGECYADSPNNRNAHTAFKPYLYLMRAKAGAAMHSAAGRVAEALGCAERGLNDLLSHYCRHASLKAYRQSDEVRALEVLRLELSRKNRSEDQANLRRALRIAVLEERFEDAARLRDALQKKGRGG